MISTHLLGGLAVVVGAGLYYYSVRSARRHQWSTRVLAVLSTASGIALIVMVLTDLAERTARPFLGRILTFAAVLSSPAPTAQEVKHVAQAIDEMRSRTVESLDRLLKKGGHPPPRLNASVLHGSKTVS